SLEPTHSLVSFLPLNGMPLHHSVGSRTSSRCCRHLLCLLSPFAKRSRKERPDGSLPACAWGTYPYPFHYRAAFAFSIVPYPHAYQLPLRVAFPCGRRVGLPRSVSVPEWVRLCLFAGGPPSAPGNGGVPVPDHLPVGSSLSASLAGWVSRRLLTNGASLNGS